MEKLQPFLRWLAIAIVAGALVFAFFVPHRQDVAAVDDVSTPPSALSVTATPSADPSSDEASAATPAPSPSPAMVAVYVCGAVRKPGVYRLAAGSRVVDAVNLAGGLAADADAEAVNLASPLEDGMKVDIFKKGAVPAEIAGGDPIGDGSAAPSASSTRTSSSRSRGSHRSSSRSSHKLQRGQTLDINTASEAELTQLPGVGPSLARRIVEYRQDNGPFATVDDLQNVSGIGPSKFAKMQPYVTVSGS